jgi:hypothetical protein
MDADDRARTDRSGHARDSRVSGPVVIGGTGGSGTRVLARLLIELGVFMGAERNAEADAVVFADFDWRWGQELLALELSGHQEEFDEWASAVPEAAEEQFIDAVRAFSPDSSGLWGWKHPHSYLLLPFLKKMFPQMRFIQVLRDGRDIALSENQRQVKYYGQFFLGPAAASEPAAVRSAAFWSHANCLAADYALAQFPGAYLPVRLEDVCADPAAVLHTLANYLGLPPPAATVSRAARQVVAAPPTLGRWRGSSASLIAQIEEAADAGLLRFSYQISRKTDGTATYRN